MSWVCARTLRSMTSSPRRMRGRVEVARAQHHRPAEDRGERRAQLVGERGQELVLGPVGLLRRRARLLRRAVERARCPRPGRPGGPAPRPGRGRRGRSARPDCAERQVSAPRHALARDRGTTIIERAPMASRSARWLRRRRPASRRSRRGERPRSAAAARGGSRATAGRAPSGDGREALQLLGQRPSSLGSAWATSSAARRAPCSSRTSMTHQSASAGTARCDQLGERLLVVEGGGEGDARLGQEGGAALGGLGGRARGLLADELDPLLLRRRRSREVAGEDVDEPLLGEGGGRPAQPAIAAGLGGEAVLEVGDAALARWRSFASCSLGGLRGRRGARTRERPRLQLLVAEAERLAPSSG